MTEKDDTPQTDARAAEIQAAERLAAESLATVTERLRRERVYAIEASLHMVYAGKDHLSVSEAATGLEALGISVAVDTVKAVCIRILREAEEHLQAGGETAGGMLIDLAQTIAGECGVSLTYTPAEVQSPPEPEPMPAQPGEAEA